MAGQQNSDRRIPFPSDVSVLPGEKIIRVARFHWGIYWKGFAVLAFALLLLLTIWPLGVFMSLIAAGMLGVAYLTKTYLLLILTNRRFLVRSGLIRMDTIQIPLDRIESVELERTIPAMLMGYAAVVITGTGSRIVGVPYVDQPQPFRRLVDEMIYARSHKEEESKPNEGA